MYLEVVKAAGTAGPYDVSGLVRTDEGVWYDPNPDRTTDLVVPNHVAVVDGGLADDLAYSAPLDALLPALTGTFPGQIAGESVQAHRHRLHRHERRGTVLPADRHSRDDPRGGRHLGVLRQVRVP